MRLLRALLTISATLCHGRRGSFSSSFGSRKQLQANDGSYLSVGANDEATRLASLLLALQPNALRRRLEDQQKTLAMNTIPNVGGSVRSSRVILTSESSRRGIARMEDDTPSPDPIIKDAAEKFKKSVASTTENLATLQAGRATPSLLDRVEVNYYDIPTPLNQLASITAPTATQLLIDVYDKSCMDEVEKAIMMSDVGMTPMNDGKVIRLNMPVLTEDRRKELAKNAKKLGEDGKVAIRNIRKTAMDKIKKMKKAIGEDVFKDAEQNLQKEVKKYEEQVEKQVAAREKEILSV